ncbi:MAG TPA: hypothetical protein PKN60_09110 [Bacteroidales bacterium]|jgi:hypothetical protein|nr:hypothetical protein [Bacteroidales bacterium]
MYKSIRAIMISLLALLATGVAGQKKVNTPFARYGIGNLELQGNSRTLAMGGISSGIRDNLTLNYLTPASYSSTDTTSFLFDFGIDYAMAKLKGDGLRYYSQDITFAHLMLGFPIMKGWGVAAAVMPYANGSYSIGYRSEGSGVTGSLYELHNGSGGFQKALFGTGLRLLPFVSAGANIFYMFGEETRINDFAFTADNNHFNTRKQGTSGMRGFGYDASVQFMLNLSGGRFIIAGLTYTPAYDLKTNNEDVTMRYSTASTSIFSIDTLTHAKLSTTSRMPQSFRAGFSLGKSDKLTAGADVVYTRWTKASLPGTYGTYIDALSLHAGAEYIPERYSNYSFFDRIEYRIGCRYGEGYTLFGADELKEYGITFGTGIPMKRSRSRISLMVDLSTRGGNGSIPRETRISVGASLNLYDYWFIKRQYD